MKQLPYRRLPGSVQRGYPAPLARPRLPTPSLQETRSRSSLPPGGDSEHVLRDRGRPPGIRA